MSIHSASLCIRYDNLSFLFGLKLIEDPLIICSKRSKGKYIVTETVFFPYCQISTGNLDPLVHVTIRVKEDVTSLNRSFII